MSDDSTSQCLLFPGVFRKPVVARFDQREGSSDGGALLLKAIDRHYDLVAGLASCLRDERQAGKVDHSLRELAVCESDPRTNEPNRSRPDSRRRSRTLKLECCVSLRTKLSGHDGMLYINKAPSPRARLIPRIAPGLKRRGVFSVGETSR